MCFATPIKVKSKISKNCWMLENGATINTAMVSGVRKGTWLLCHADLAINKIEEVEAEEILKLNNKCSHTETK